MEKKYLSIGQFSKMSRASAKSLRYYDEIGLFSPAYTDPETGYRYYNINQIYELNLVRFCIEEGIPTEQIKQQRKSGSMIEAKQFFKQCWDIAEKRLAEAQATVQRMEAYNLAYAKQMTDDMLEVRRPTAIENLTLATIALDCKGTPTRYSQYLEKLTACLQMAAEAGLTTLAHQGVILDENGRWRAFVNISANDLPDASALPDGLSVMALPSANYFVTNTVSANVNRCFEEVFLLDSTRTPSFVLEAWAYATFLNIPAFSAYYSD